LMGLLERRTEAISGEFKSQAVANTLWAYPTMGAPGRRAEDVSGEFNSQNVANTLWAFATMRTKPGELLMGQLERRAEVISRGVQLAGCCNHAVGVLHHIWAYSQGG
jgi:hypothetical protein